jgi:polyisoprenoid-binding protein YceI
VTATPDIQLKPAESARLATGRWRLAPADSFVSFTARLPWRRVQGRLPLTGEVLVAEPVEESCAWLSARTSAVGTGSPLLDRLLAGPAFLDAHAYPDISFRSDLLIWVPAGWRAVGRLRVKNIEHELACQFGVQFGEPGRQEPVITCRWVIDSAWVATQRIPALDRRIEMTCSFRLQPDVQGAAARAV